MFLHLVFLRPEQRGRSTCPRAHQLSVLSEGQRGFSLCWPCRGNLQALIDSPVRNSSLSSRKKNLRPVFFFLWNWWIFISCCRFVLFFLQSGVLEFSSTPSLTYTACLFLVCVRIAFLRWITWFCSVVYMKIIFSTWLLQRSRVCWLFKNTHPTREMGRCKKLYMFYIYNWKSCVCLPKYLSFSFVQSSSSYLHCEKNSTTFKT